MADKRRKNLGNLGERLAATKLAEIGYRLVETNWRCAIGEIDIIAWHGNCLAFIEVRTRRGNGAGTPEDSITPTKQQRLLNLVEAYLQAHATEPIPQCRIDLAAVEFDAQGRLIRLEIRQNIVEAE